MRHSVLFQDGMDVFAVDIFGAGQGIQQIADIGIAFRAGLMGKTGIAVRGAPFTLIGVVEVLDGFLGLGCTATEYQDRQQGSHHPMKQG